MERKTPDFAAHVRNAVISLIAIAALEFFTWAGVRIPSPEPIYLVVIACVAYQGGLVSGLISALLMLIYAGYVFATPGYLLHYTTDSTIRLVVLLITAPLIASVVAMLRRDVCVAKDEIDRLTSTDQLTQVKNRRALFEFLEREIARTRRTRHPLSVLFVDIDHFKTYNDTFGHEAGDEALKIIGNRLKESVRVIDIVGRFGGEEFVVVLPDTTKEGAMVLAERLRRSIEGTTFPHQQITASFGMSTLGGERLGAKPPIEAHDLVSEADKAVTASKTGGRNRVTHAQA